MAKLVAKTYGEALFELALESETLDTIIDEVTVTIQAFNENEELLKLLNHPKIGKDEKVSVIENIFKGRISDTFVGFLVIIVQKDRYNEFDGIFEYFMSLVREHKSIGVATVTSAVTLSKEQREQVEQRLLQTTKYKQFQINYMEDPSLIGGMVIRIGDRVVDSSIRTKLDHLQKDLKKIQLA